MSQSQRYVVRYEKALVDRSFPVVFGKFSLLHDAIVARSACSHSAHVLDVPSGLELHKVGVRLKWLDEYGREQPPPR